VVHSERASESQTEPSPDKSGTRRKEDNALRFTSTSLSEAKTLLAPSRPLTSNLRPTAPLPPSSAP
jgi:hypothetical protein